MATKNIEININNGNGYDILYPKTVMANITDWQNNVYSKSQTYSRSEVYSRSETYTKNEVNSLLGSGSGLKIMRSSYRGTGGTTNSIIYSGPPVLLFIKTQSSCNVWQYDITAVGSYGLCDSVIGCWFTSLSRDAYVEYQTNGGNSGNYYGNIYFKYSNPLINITWAGSVNKDEAVCNKNNYTYEYLVVHE